MTYQILYDLGNKILDFYTQHRTVIELSTPFVILAGTGLLAKIKESRIQKNGSLDQKLKMEINKNRKIPLNTKPY